MHFHSNLGSRGGKYSGLTNAEICKKYCESMTEAKKEKKLITKQRWREYQGKPQDQFHKMNRLSQPNNPGAEV